ncbi:glycosyltransferase [Streptomyces sp. TRM43335]|uniref:Glycosyltransferase n=1 Tax=Streptomyces taklimakanensis TaxID=2569853 RepID=A0A6G2BHU5_9ACTN|nr:glycosyltransferase [Streptomyces taklimakanensis]MTE21820.1 glycosyltransferase [Streptomyces taklimakanensis]
MPRFSVICPTYNRGPAILSTLESVRAQTVEDWELIVASDGSDDDTDEVVAEVAARDGRVRLLRTPRFGFQAGPTNLALKEVSGEVVAYLDHDDRWDPHHLALLAEVFDEGASFAATRARKVTAAGEVVSVADPLTMCWHPELQLMNPLFENSCAAHRVELAERVGGWTESPIGLEDWDLWVRLTDTGARCTTLLDVSVSMLEDPSTRQHRLPCAYEHEIARFPDARGARAAYRALTHPRHFEAGYEAATRDLLEWYGSLADRGELVYPRGWQGGRAALERAVRRHVRAVRPVWHNLIIEPRDGHHALAMVLGTMSAAHAERYSAYFRRTMRHQQAFFEEVLPEGSVLR